MYAVVETGSKQYRVHEGLTIKVDKLSAEEGSDITLDKVLMLVGKDNNIKIGAPYLDGTKVVAKVKKHGRHPKIRIIKVKRRKHYQKEQGHRQDFTALEIANIQE